MQEKNGIGALGKHFLGLVACLCFFISPVEAAASGHLLSAFQDISIQGKVTDGYGKPLPGVTVTLKAGSGITVTDKDGNYSIKVPNRESVLVFSSMGYTVQEIKVLDQRTINLQMKEERMSLDEVVVIGYGTATRGDLVGSVSSIKAEDIRKSSSISFQEAIQGKVAGVQITSNSGEPGAGVNVLIRGNNSVNAGSQPLYVIDGIQIDVNNDEAGGHRFGSNVRYNPLSGINPSDIQSIEILKDAAATAIYGSRGANGVVIVTTKDQGGPANSIDLDVYHGVSDAIRKLDMLSGQDFAQYRFDRTPNLIYGEDTNGDGIADQVRDFSGSEVNWQDDAMRTAHIQSYNIGINSGGNAKTTVSSSFGYLNQEGIVDKNRFERYTGRLQAQYQIDPNLSLGGTLNFNRSVSSGVTASAGGGQYFGVIESFVLFRPLLTPEGDEMGNPDNGGLSNPRTFLDDASKIIPNNRLLYDAHVSYNFLKHFTLRLSAGGMMSQTKGREWYPSTTSWGFSRNGMALLLETEANSWQTSNTLTYARSFDGGHYLNTVLGFELNEYEFNSLSTRGESFENQNFNPVYDIGQAAVFPENAQTDYWGTTRESEFLRINYSFKDRYLFTGSIRRDGSSKFGSNNKYAWFPAAGLAWKINNESFLSRFKSLKELKLRTSYGISGNDRIDAYRSLSRAERAYYASQGGNADLGLAPAEIENPNLKWETTRQANIGLDVQIANGRIGLIADWYKKWTMDMLLRADVPSQTGSYRQWRNIGQVNNSGLEITLNTLNIEKDHFTWSSNFNISMNRNMVVSLGGGSPIPVNIPGGHINDVGRVAVGYPIGTGWGYVLDGIYQAGNFNPDGTLRAGVPAYPGASALPGDMRFRDLDNDGVIDPLHDKTAISDSNPLHTGGFTNSFTYKGIDLNIFFQWVYGNDIINLGRYRYEGYIPFYNMSYDYYQNHWSTTNRSNTIPAIEGKGKTESSSYYVEDGSFLRLKNVSLGYTLPQSVGNKLKMSNVRLYVSGENLATWTNYSGMDPEVSYWNTLLTGLDYMVYPRPRTFTLGFNAKF